MTQGELIKKWKEQAEHYENMKLEVGYYEGEDKVYLAKAEVFRECASDLEALTY